MDMKAKTIIASPLNERYFSLALLILRVVASAYMLTHGWAKLTGFSDMSAQFPDPIGVGSTLSLALIIGAEFFASLFIILGLFTRLAAVPIVIAMSVAAFVIHSADPFNVKELALLYLVVYIFILMAGAGRYSLDYLFFGKRG